MKLKKIVAAVLAGAMALSMAGCVDQHPEDNADSDVTTSIENAKLVVTSPAVAEICDKLELDLVGVCNTNGTLPDRYKDLTKVGMAMNPDFGNFKVLLILIMFYLQIHCSQIYSLNMLQSV